MSDEEIISMAREAGMLVVRDHIRATMGPLMAFATAIAKREREECAKVCIDGWIGPSYEFDLGRQHCAKKIREREDAKLHTMDDENLLKLAAKAAGIEIVFWYQGDPMVHLPTPFESNSESWNPLKYDKDALSLAARMNLVVDFDTTSGIGMPEMLRRKIVLRAIQDIAHGQ